MGIATADPPSSLYQTGQHLFHTKPDPENEQWKILTRPPPKQLPSSAAASCARAFVYRRNRSVHTVGTAADFLGKLAAMRTFCAD